MKNTTTILSVLTFLAILMTNGRTFALEQDSKTVTGRLNVLKHEQCIQAHVYLKNNTDREIPLVTGHGEVSRSVAPSFFSGSTHLTAANWKGSPTRAMKPVTLTLAPREERLYEVYVLPLPPGETIEGIIHFDAADRQGVHEYTVKLASEKLPKQAAKKQK